MPRILPQEMKSISTIEAQPERMTSRLHLIVLMDIAGHSGVDIARSVGITQSRVSLIRNSPIYLETLVQEREALKERVLDKGSTRVVEGDPIERKLKSLALEAVGTYEHILRNGHSEGVQKVTADSVLDRAGYKPYTERVKTTIELTDKIAQRFERALSVGEEKNEHSGTERTTTVSYKEEVST